jgi:hypothetical protein
VRFINYFYKRKAAKFIRRKGGLMKKKFLVLILITVSAQIGAAQIAPILKNFTCVNYPRNGDGYIYQVQHLENEASLTIKKVFIWHGRLTNEVSEIYQDAIHVTDTQSGKIVLENEKTAAVLDPIGPESSDETTGIIVHTPAPVVEDGELRCKPGLFEGDQF